LFELTPANEISLLDTCKRTLSKCCVDPLRPPRLSGVSPTHNSDVDSSSVVASEMNTRQHETDSIRLILEGTASETGELFFAALVRKLTEVLGVTGAWVTEYLPKERRLRARSFWFRDHFIPDYEYAIENSPCESVIEQHCLIHYPDRIIELFPRDPDLPPLDAVSYIGAPLMDVDGAVAGHLAALDDKPMPLAGNLEALFRIFAARAAAEIQRLSAEAKARRFGEQAAYFQQEIAADHNYREMLGHSPPMRNLAEAIRQVAPTEATVLIQGETGTGKELVARAIHTASRRASQPLIKVNCAALPATLIESELFGHERGAFTGASQQREGRFALAHGGTIFLDEIGEMPLEVQPKLLRVLQEGEFEPVGSSHSRKVDVRVIAATNRDLARESAEGRFRQDLYYRLNVFPLRVPPLREREEDMGLLAEAFARKLALKVGRPVALPLSADCIRQLRSYDWPGNVRELQNLMERAVIRSNDGQLRLDLAPLAPISSQSTPQPVLSAADLRELERLNLLRALENSSWRIAGPKGAAAMLGVPPATLGSRMKALGVVRPTKNRS
jgi:formate hydrogenlyase transcriptional activator